MELKSQAGRQQRTEEKKGVEKTRTSTAITAKVLCCCWCCCCFFLCRIENGKSENKLNEWNIPDAIAHTGTELNTTELSWEERQQQQVAARSIDNKNKTHSMASHMHDSVTQQTKFVGWKMYQNMCAMHASTVRLRWHKTNWKIRSIRRWQRSSHCGRNAIIGTYVLPLHYANVCDRKENTAKITQNMLSSFSNMDHDKTTDKQ